MHQVQISPIHLLVYTVACWSWAFDLLYVLRHL